MTPNYRFQPTPTPCARERRLKLGVSQPDLTTMSTSETVTFDLGACPCGAGRINRHVTTQDNPWSTTDISIIVECGRCRTEWRIDGSFLVLRGSETAQREVKSKEAQVYRQLRALTEDLVDRYFERFGAKNKKAELAEMERLGISNLSYRRYLEYRKSGRSPGQAACGLRNKEWLLSQAQEPQSHDQLMCLIAQHEHVLRKTAEAAKEVVCRRIG